MEALGKILLNASASLSDARKFFAGLILMLGFVFSGLMLQRIYFYLKYSADFAGFQTSEILGAFLSGARFDLAASAISVAPIALILAPSWGFLNHKLRRPVFWAALCYFVVLLGYSYIDVHYYAFSQRHMTFELQNAWAETDAILKIAGMEYLWPALGFFAVTGGVSFVYLRSMKGIVLAPDGRGWKGAIIGGTLSFAIVAVMFAVFIRGGLQMKPLGVKDAFRSEHVELGVLSLNGLYTTYNSLYESARGRGHESPLGDIKINPKDKIDVLSLIKDPSREVNDPDYPLLRKFAYKPDEERRLNVVLFIMESWSGKYSKALGGKVSATPFFDSLSEDGLLLTNCLASGQRSIEGLSGLLSSTPVWSGMTFGKGGLLYQTRMEPVGAVFKSMGYETLFIHGARPGSMGFDGLIGRAGFARHISRDDFAVSPATDDGVWGIFDHIAFARANEEFRAIKGPFFATVYSLSSHTPYTVPSKEFEVFGPETEYREFLNSLYYSDQALKIFFEAAKKEEYFKNTLFVIVSDHTEGRATADNKYVSYHIPCLFYAPGTVAPARDARLTAQMDIAPTIMDILKISRPFTSFGRSALSNAERRALIQKDENFIWVEDPYMLVTNLDEPLSLLNYREAPDKNLLKSKNKDYKPIALAMQNEILNYIEWSHAAISENRLAPAGEGK